MSLSGSIDPVGHPRLNLTIRGPLGSEAVSVVVDTGFTGALGVTLPLVQRLGLLRSGVRPIELADGTIKVVPAYLAEVEWVQGPATVEALQSHSERFSAGARLLRGTELVINYSAAQSVEVR
jgi:clan AA aspartic protease